MHREQTGHEFLYKSEVASLTRSGEGGDTWLEYKKSLWGGSKDWNGLE